MQTTESMERRDTVCSLDSELDLDPNLHSKLSTMISAGGVKQRERGINKGRKQGRKQRRKEGSSHGHSVPTPKEQIRSVGRKTMSISLNFVDFILTLLCRFCGFVRIVRCAIVACLSVYYGSQITCCFFAQPRNLPRFVVSVRFAPLRDVVLIACPLEAMRWRKSIVVSPLVQEARPHTTKIARNNRMTWNTRSIVGLPMIFRHELVV